VTFLNKILLVDFVNKKVIGAYEGPSGQAVTSLTELVESRKRVTEAIDRIDSLMKEIQELKKGDQDGD
jgi:hypothetical protein